MRCWILNKRYNIILLIGRKTSQTKTYFPYNKELEKHILMFPSSFLYIYLYYSYIFSAINLL